MQYLTLTNKNPIAHSRGDTRMPCKVGGRRVPKYFATRVYPCKRSIENSRQLTNRNKQT